MRLALVPLAAAFSFDVENPGVCALRHCGAEIRGCLGDAKCRDNIGCTGKCVSKGGAIQYCAATCAAIVYKGQPTDGSKGDLLSTCLYNPEHQCLPLPFPMVDKCQVPAHSRELSMHTLSDGGAWWAVYGYNPTADCGPCQQRHIHPDAGNASQWLYDYTLLTKLDQGHWGNWTLHTPLHPTTEQLARMTSWVWPWSVPGLRFVEQWYLLDEQADYLQVYYCLTMPGRPEQLEGGLVLAHRPGVPDAALPSIRSQFAGVGKDFSKFCKVDNSCVPPTQHLVV